MEREYEKIAWWKKYIAVLDFSSEITVNVKNYSTTRLYYSIGQDVMSCRSTNQVPYTCL